MSGVEREDSHGRLTTRAWLVPIAPRPVRAPFSPPRARSAAGPKAAAARDWLCAALALDSQARVELNEWTAYDSRGRTHTIAFVARGGSKTVAFAIFKDLEGVSRDDVFAAAKAAARDRDA